MYKIKEISPDERDLFDEAIKKFPQCDFMQTYTWGDLKEKSGWKPIRLLFYKGETLKGAASILKKKLPFCNYSFFYIPRGPLLETYDDLPLFEVLMDSIKDIAQREKAIFIKLDPDIHGPAPVLKGYLKSKGFKRGRERGNFTGIQPKHVCRLHLDKTLDEVFNKLSSKTRYNIRLAQKKGVQVIEANIQDLPAFYGILEETCERDNFRVRSLSYFEDLYNEFVAKGKGKLLLASYNGQYIAGIMVLTHGPKAWYLYGASSNRHRDVMPNYLLQWTAITWAHERGCKIYDFLGVASSFDPNSPLYGMYKFKSGFNPEVVEFIGEFDWHLNKGMYVLWNIVEPLYLKTQVNLGKFNQYLKKVLSRKQNLKPAVE